MKKMKYLFILSALTLVITSCGKKNNSNNNNSSEGSEEESSTSSTYYGPTDLFVAFYLDYNVADFDNPYYSYKTHQGQLLTPPPNTPTREDATDPTYPIFKGWSAHTVIDDDADLWDFSKDYVELGTRTYLYLYGIWEAEEEPIVPDEFTNFAMYRVGNNDWTKVEMSVNSGNTDEYCLTNLELAADTEITFCIAGDVEDDWYHYSDLKPASVGTYEESPAYLHDDGETYSDGNIIVKQAGKYDIYLDITADKDDNKALYMARDTSQDPAVEKVFYLAPGVWAADGAWFAIYAYGPSGNTWVKLTQNGSYYSASINITTYNQIIFTRMDPSKTLADGWDAKWNQSPDLRIDEGNLYTITDWSGGTWSTI